MIEFYSIILESSIFWLTCEVEMKEIKKIVNEMPMAVDVGVLGALLELVESVGISSLERI